MKKIILLLILISVASVSTIFYMHTHNSLKKQEVTVVLDYKNISYTIDGQDVQLINGKSEIEVAPGSASKIVTTYFGNEVKKDLNNDGREDVVFLLTQETRGSGTFFYVVAALDTENGWVGSHATLLGDRIAPQTTESGPQNSVIMNYMDRAFGEPMTTKPSVGKSLRLILDTKSLQFGEFAQNFEGEANPTSMNLTMKTWKWVKTQYNDDTVAEPKKDVFTITFKNDGTFAATTDCNGIGGNYTTTKSTILFRGVISTLMFCEGSQEHDFKSIFENTEGYTFTSKGELVLNLKLDSGSVYFR